MSDLHALEPGPARILLVGDNPADARLVRKMLDEDIGSWTIEHVERLASARERLLKGDVDAVLLDLGLPDSAGLDTVRSLCSAFPEVPVLVLTGVDDDALGFKTVQEGAQDYLCKERMGSRALARCLRYSIERERAQEQLRFQARLLESVEDGLIAVDLSGRIVYWNRAAERIQGSSSAEAVGRDFRDVLVPPEGRAAADLVPRAPGSKPWQGELELQRRDGSRCPVLATVSSISSGRGDAGGLIWVFADLSERKRQEEAQRSSQKLESLGVLAGGVAHDFNNLLGAILGFNTLALRKLPPDSPARENLKKSSKAVERAADLTRQILAYSGRGHLEIRPLDLNTLVRENLHLFEVAVPKKVLLRALLAESLPPIEADSGQMQQVVMNLIINGAQAIGEKEGTVTLHTRTQEVAPKDERLWRHTGEPLRPGLYVSLEVHDTGGGMDAQTVSRIFDPFFTTKETGRGLGLAAVLGIVRSHKGGLTVYSEVGRGTIFKLLFPASRDAQAAAATPPSEVAAAGGLIVVIEDDEAMREMITEMLTSEGYVVVTASNGEEGLALCRVRRSEVRLVLSDLSMPGMSGDEVFQKLVSTAPEIPVLLSSGYHELEATRRLVGQGLAGFVQKPYQPSTLLSAVRRCLARKA